MVCKSYEVPFAAMPRAASYRIKSYVFEVNPYPYFPSVCPVLESDEILDHSIVQRDSKIALPGAHLMV